MVLHQSGRIGPRTLEGFHLSDFSWVVEWLLTLLMRQKEPNAGTKSLVSQRTSLNASEGRSALELPICIRSRALQGQFWLGASGWELRRCKAVFILCQEYILHRTQQAGYLHVGSSLEFFLKYDGSKDELVQPPPRNLNCKYQCNSWVAALLYYSYSRHSKPFCN